MSDTLLKKDFKKKDVTRLRSLIKGTSTEGTVTGVGYEKKYESHKEGDVWQDNDYTWTIKDGIKQNITKLDEAKKAILFPLFCPSCSKLMKKNTDKSFYYQYKRCTDCQIDFENDLKVRGLWDNYEKLTINEDVDNVSKDFNIWFEEYLNQQNSFFSEAGDSENWSGDVKEKLLSNKEETIKFLQSLKK